MKNLVILFCSLALTLLLSAVSFAANQSVMGKKVLVVMSYHEDNEWELQIKEGLEQKLQGAIIEYFWLDSKKNLEKISGKAKEAYALYQKFQPDGVIAADDNAQAFFVLPFLKDKVKTPVVFCGVNNEATKYGYPASNVTGVVEKSHYRESLSYAQIIDSSIKSFGIIYKDTPTARANLKQINQEQAQYTVKLAETVKVATVEEVKKAVAGLSTKVDILLCLDLAGLQNQKGEFVEEVDVLRMIAQLWQKPSVGGSEWELEAGMLCGVVKNGREQGDLAVEMLLQLWEGKAARDIPLTQNKNGRRVINLKAAQSLGIKLPPEAVMGAKVTMSK